MPKTSNLITHFKFQTLDVANVLAEFKNSIHLNKFFENSENLWNNSTLVKFSQDNWRMRPDKFCLDYYSEPYLFPVVLLINNLGSIFEFLPTSFSDELIIVPDKSRIIKLLST